MSRINKTIIAVLAVLAACSLSASLEWFEDGQTAFLGVVLLAASLLYIWRPQPRGPDGRFGSK